MSVQLIFSFTFKKYRKNTLCKILNDIKELQPWLHSILFKPLHCKPYRTKKKKFLARIFKMWQLSQKIVVHILRRFKENFIVATLDFIQVLTLFVSFLEFLSFFNLNTSALAKTVYIIFIQMTITLISLVEVCLFDIIYFYSLCRRLIFFIVKN